MPLGVLVVEDLWQLAQGMKAILVMGGHRVLGPVATRAGALRLVETEDIDIAVVDINLRGEMAFGLVDNLNQRGIRVVVVTGYESLPEIDGRADAVLSKPVHAKELLRTLRSIAGRQARCALA